MDQCGGFSVVLLAFALGCGGRSALDVLGVAPLASGEDATVGESPVEAGPSSSGVTSGSGGSSGSSTGSGSGSSGSPEAGSCDCPTGCCDVYSICRPGTVDTACGQTGGGCTDCTVYGTTCVGGLCLVQGGSTSSGSSGSSSGGTCAPSPCSPCVLGMVSCSAAGACQCCIGALCLPGTSSNGGPCSCPGEGAEAGGDAGAQPPSCAPGGAGMTNCGPGGSGTESCCTSLEVPGGTYYRTYDPVVDGGATLAADGGPTGEADPATVSGFRLDRYLVTVGRFRQFVKAVLPADGGAGWTPPAGSGKHTHLNGGRGLVNVGAPPDAGTAYETGWLTSDNGSVTPTNANLACASPYDTWTNTAGSQENLPINCVNWYESYAFCIWDGGFLPSEAEREYAAAGGSQQREYPWGTAAPGTANQYAIYGCCYPSGSGSCTGVTNIAPVGTATLGAGLWGQLDLAGNMSEWNLDWYASYVDPCTDCANLTTASYRVIRGASFDDTASYLAPPDRGGNTPANRYGGGIGLRCARSP